MSLRLLMVYADARMPSSRIRILQMVPWLRRLGVEATCLPYPRTLGARFTLRRQAACHDLVLLQKRLPVRADTLLWRHLGRPLLFDFDDAIAFRQEPRAGSYLSPTRQRRFARTVRLADGIIAGNRYLASLCGGAAKPVLIAPSPVPYPVATCSARPPNPVPILGWVGGGPNLDSLAALAVPLRRLAARHPFRLHVLADQPFTCPGVEVVNLPWRLASQEEEIARFDIGLMPLAADNPWNAGKCSYKLLQYMAAGVASVASPVGMNSEVIDDGVNGLLATDEAAWERTLIRLLDDPSLRQRLGRAARQTVARAYTYPAIAGQWLAFFASAFHLWP